MNSDYDYTSLFGNLPNSAFLLLQILLLSIFIYYFVVSMFGWFKRKGIPADTFSMDKKFALIVAAHNEEAVIGNIVRNLKRLKYPKDKYDVYVIADNCDDSTARIARNEGAIVYERFDNVKKGKGYSLQWMFAKLFKLDKKYDAFCIFDADNLASSNFLMEMNKQLQLGNNVVQGYLDSKNPNDSWISGNYSIAYWIANRLFQLPRYYLGLNCALGGTGFMVATDVLEKIGWDATCLTEDLEFSVKLVLKGMKVSWSHEAIVYDEKPLHMTQSWGQRKRWMQGHCDCAVRYFGSMIKKAVKDRDIVALDCALYLIQPIVIVVNSIMAFVSATRFFYRNYYDQTQLISVHPQFHWFNMFNLTSVLLFLFFTYMNIIFIIAEKKFSWKILKYYIVSPIYGLTWIPIIILGFFERNNKVWIHTVHTRAMEIDALEKTG